ncbi:MAG TPA: MoaD/ThiS family protein [Cyclobacteriaceae bacterium]|nr:MoaD/ThiS family protein [Cyclobacteriaceae bacterium]
MTKLKVKAFGITRDMIGERELVLNMDGEKTVMVLRKTLQEKYPAIRGLKSLLIAVNNEYADDSQQLSDNDEIALIPPVSGG